MNEQVNIENLSSKILLFLFSKLKPTKTPPYCNQLRNIDIILLLIDIKPLNTSTIRVPILYPGLFSS